MSHSIKLLTALVLLTAAAAPTALRAESSSKSDSQTAAQGKNSKASDDFEENRRAHMQKSKENNANKGAN